MGSRPIRNFLRARMSGPAPPTDRLRAWRGFFGPRGWQYSMESADMAGVSDEKKDRPNGSELSERERQVLDAVVRMYVDTAEPAGSRTLSRAFDLGVSPAT